MDVGSTAPERIGLDSARRGQVGRRLGLGFVALFVLTGVAQGFGVRTATVSETGPRGTTVHITYGRVTRPGLATVWKVTITKPDGFEDNIVVTTNAGYFAAFDENGWSPEPIESTADGDNVSLTFAPPEGTAFEVSLDARIEPGVQWRQTGTSTVMIGDEVIGALEYTTWVVP